jgi:LysM repeat protein
VQTTGWLAVGVTLALAVVGLRGIAPAGAASAAVPSRMAATEIARPAAPVLLGVLPSPEEEPRTHEVAAGDTLSAIAAASGVGIDALLTANDLEAPDRLELGRVLIIPTR